MGWKQSGILAPLCEGETSHRTRLLALDPESLAFHWDSEHFWEPSRDVREGNYARNEQERRTKTKEVFRFFADENRDRRLRVTEILLPMSLWLLNPLGGSGLSPIIFVEMPTRRAELDRNLYFEVTPDEPKLFRLYLDLFTSTWEQARDWQTGPTRTSSLQPTIGSLE